MSDPTPTERDREAAGHVFDAYYGKAGNTMERGGMERMAAVIAQVRAEEQEALRAWAFAAAQPSGTLDFGALDDYLTARGKAAP